jgi:hypothetical protein
MTRAGVFMPPLSPRARKEMSGARQKFVNEL